MRNVEPDGATTVALHLAADYLELSERSNFVDNCDDDNNDENDAAVGHPYIAGLRIREFLDGTAEPMDYRSWARTKVEQLRREIVGA